MGRPTKLTPAVQARIVEAVAAGNYYEAAAAYGGVPYDTFNDWMGKGKDGHAPHYVQFFHAVTEAAAQAEIGVVESWTKHIPENCRRAATSSAAASPNDGGRRSVRT